MQEGEKERTLNEPVRLTDPAVPGSICTIKPNAQSIYIYEYFLFEVKHQASVLTADKADFSMSTEVI